MSYLIGLAASYPIGLAGQIIEQSNWVGRIIWGEQDGRSNKEAARCKHSKGSDKGGTQHELDGRPDKERRKTREA
jgi:hypothetical protein